MDLDKVHVKMFEFLDPWKYGNNLNPEGDYSAVLNEDLKGNLPAQFTICNSILVVNINPSLHTKSPFNVNYEDGSPWFWMNIAYNGHMYQAYRNGDIFTGNGKSKIYPARFNVWEHLCVGVDTDTGMFTTVQRGIVAFNEVMPVFVNSSSIKPTNLKGKLILGKYAGVPPSYNMHAVKVGNVNIYSTKLSIDDMKSITNGERCNEGGDYLAWKDSKWRFKEEISEEGDIASRECSKSDTC